MEGTVTAAIRERGEERSREGEGEGGRKKLRNNKREMLCDQVVL